MNITYRFLKKIIFKLGVLHSIVLTSGFHDKKVAILGFFKAGSLSRYFKYFGKNIFIHYSSEIIGFNSISIKDNVTLAANGTLAAWNEYNGDIYSPNIIIDEGTTIGEGFHITSINSIYIGKNVLTGKYITISDNSHGSMDKGELNTAPAKRKLFSKGGVYIGDNVWIADKVTILPGIKIGENSIIGSNSVVTKNIPDNCIAAGNPARIIRII
ncbi:Hexapeptide repeat of succinyl-transferase [Chryseobacterium taichungense]|uniref:Hexapeptide repeat of succinyl-transferase n=1 Tax=Chryseobacterium taichungense TaxID=295069 RepID=A0A1H7VSR7_9FLAO|nr:acyltransferase [Chryseobacterium taichungense]SEM12291.1 Hexapeptide repeat of succinyl-transferase [Chryseobacterium taichungense]